MTQLTQILSRLERGDQRAAEELLPLVYQELRELAAARMAQEHSPQKHDATSLVHEAYLRLVGDGAQRGWDSRGHFFAAAAEAMRRILVDNARRSNRVKHGGDRKRVNLDDDIAQSLELHDDVLALDEALTRFGAREPEKAQLVKLRYFAGLTLEEAAAAMAISPATAKRHWAYARACLYNDLTDGDLTDAGTS